MYWLLQAPEGTAAALAESLHTLDAQVHLCERCCNVTAIQPCLVCADTRRQRGTICVVEHPQDVLAFERSGEFRGQYHVLHGALSPLDGITPDQLRIRELLDRLRDDVEEVIMATDPDVEGDATALYLHRMIKPLGIKVTRLAHGISVGTEIEYADAVSLSRALQNRREL